MIFKDGVDSDGIKVVLKQSYNESSGHYYNVLKEELFIKPSDELLSKIDIINHYIKSNMVLKFEDFEDLTPPYYDEDFEKMNFQSVFASLFDNAVESFKKTFYIENGELVNLHEGSVFFHDKKTGKIGWRKIEGDELINSERDNLLLKYEKQNGRRKSKKDLSLDITEFVYILPSLHAGWDFQYQYLNYIHSLLNNSDFLIDSEKVKSKALDFLINKGEIEHVNNMEEFLRDLLIIDKNYISNSIFNKKEEYVVNQDVFDLYNKGSIFSLMDGKMSDFFYYTYNRRPGKRFSFLSGLNESSPLLSKYERNVQLVKNTSLSMQRIESVEKTVKVYNKINNLFLYRTYDFNQSSDYLLDRERAYDINDKYHQIDKISYLDFINHYEIEDYAVNRCLFEYIGEYILFNKKIENYINSLVLDFSSLNEKLKIINQSDSESLKYSFSSFNLKKINNKLDLPVDFIKASYDESVNIDRKRLSQLIIKYTERSKLEEYDILNESFSVLLNKFFRDYVETEREMDSLFDTKENVFNFTNDNTIEFLKIIESFIHEKGEGLKGKIVNESDVLELLSFEFSSSKKKDEKSGKTKIEHLKNFVNRNIILCLMGDEGDTQESLIKNIDSLVNIFDLDLNRVFLISGSRGTPFFDDKRSWSFNIFGSAKYTINVLNYYLLKGYDDVVMHLKEKGINPNVDKEKGLSSLEYAIVGRSSNTLIDWICQNLNINSCYLSKVFGFLVYPVGSSYDTSFENRIMIKRREFVHCLFTQGEECKEKEVLNKMVYVYEKYGVNFNFSLNRLRYLLSDSESAFILKNKLGLDNNIIRDIEYGLYITNLLCTNDFDGFKKEVVEGRLNFHTELGLNVDDEKETPFTRMGILTLIYAFVGRFNYTQDKDVEKVLESTISILLDNLLKEHLNDLHNVVTHNEMNVIEVLMEKNVRRYQELIKRLALDFDFNLGGSKMVAPMIIASDEKEPAKENKSYRELYFSNSDYELTLFDKLMSEIEKEKIEKIVDNSPIKERSKRRI